MMLTVKNPLILEKFGFRAPFPPSVSAGHKMWMVWKENNKKGIHQADGRLIVPGITRVWSEKRKMWLTI